MKKRVLSLSAVLCLVIAMLTCMTVISVKAADTINNKPVLYEDDPYILSVLDEEGLERYTPAENPNISYVENWLGEPYGAPILWDIFDAEYVEFDMFVSETPANAGVDMRLRMHFGSEHYILYDVQSQFTTQGWNHIKLTIPHGAVEGTPGMYYPDGLNLQIIDEVKVVTENDLRNVTRLNFLIEGGDNAQSLEVRWCNIVTTRIQVPLGLEYVYNAGPIVYYDPWVEVTTAPIENFSQTGYKSLEFDFYTSEYERNQALFTDAKLNVNLRPNEFANYLPFGSKITKAGWTHVKLDVSGRNLTEGGIVDTLTRVLFFFDTGVVTAPDTVEYPAPAGKIEIRNIVFTKDMIGLEARGCKDVYNEGEAFDPTGMEVEAVFSDNTRVMVPKSLYTYEAPNNPLQVGDTAVAIKYKYDRTKAASLPITVKVYYSNLDDDIFEPGYSLDHNTGIAWNHNIVSVEEDYPSSGDYDGLPYSLKVKKDGSFITANRDYTPKYFGPECTADLEFWFKTSTLGILDQSVGEYYFELGNPDRPEDVPGFIDENDPGRPTPRYRFSLKNLLIGKTIEEDEWVQILIPFSDADAEAINFPDIYNITWAKIVFGSMDSVPDLPASPSIQFTDVRITQPELSTVVTTLAEKILNKEANVGIIDLLMVKEKQVG